MKHRAELAVDAEELGREEASYDCPHLPRVSQMSKEEYWVMRRRLRTYARARAQGLHHLRGREAKVYAQNWAFGYMANCALYEDEGFLDGEERMTQEDALIHGEQTILSLAHGVTLYSAGEEYALGSYVRFEDEQGHEIYYDKAEWEEEPEEVMGVILTIIQNPAKFREFFEKGIGL